MLEKIITINSNNKIKTNKKGGKEVTQQLRADAIKLVKFHRSSVSFPEVTWQPTAVCNPRFMGSYYSQWAPPSAHTVVVERGGK